MRITIMFIVLFVATVVVVVNKEKLRLFRLTQFFGWRRSKCNNFSLDLLETYPIFSRQDRQLSWWFYTLEQDMQFWYTETGNFHDDFVFFIKWCHFYSVIGKFQDDFMTWTKYTIFIWRVFFIFLVPYKHKNKNR